MIDSMIPYTESEWLNYQYPMKVRFVPVGTNHWMNRWLCYCGVTCRLLPHISGGICICGREWNVDNVDKTAIMLEPQLPNYKFDVIIDRYRSFITLQSQKGQSIDFSHKSTFVITDAP